MTWLWITLAFFGGTVFGVVMMCCFIIAGQEERSLDGCVGKSNECSLCRDLSTPYRNEIREYSKKYGTLKTLMKLLNEGEIPAKDVTIWGSEVDKQNKHKKREPER